MGQVVQRVGAGFHFLFRDRAVHCVYVVVAGFRSRDGGVCAGVVAVAVAIVSVAIDVFGQIRVDVRPTVARQRDNGGNYSSYIT